MEIKNKIHPKPMNGKSWNCAAIDAITEIRRPRTEVKTCFEGRAVVCLNDARERPKQRRLNRSLGRGVAHRRRRGWARRRVEGLEGGGGKRGWRRESSDGGWRSLQPCTEASWTVSGWGGEVVVGKRGVYGGDAEVDEALENEGAVAGDEKQTESSMEWRRGGQHGWSKGGSRLGMFEGGGSGGVRAVEEKALWWEEQRSGGVEGLASWVEQGKEMASKGRQLGRLMEEVGQLERLV